MVKQHAHAILVNDRLGLLHWSGSFQSQRSTKSISSTSQSSWGAVRTQKWTHVLTNSQMCSSEAARQRKRLLTQISVLTNGCGLKHKQSLWFLFTAFIFQQFLKHFSFWCHPHSDFYILIVLLFMVKSVSHSHMFCTSSWEICRHILRTKSTKTSPRLIR